MCKGCSSTQKPWHIPHVLIWKYSIWNIQSMLFMWPISNLSDINHTNFPGHFTLSLTSMCFPWLENWLTVYKVFQDTWEPIHFHIPNNSGKWVCVCKHGDSDRSDQLYRPESDLVIAFHTSVRKHLGNILGKGTAGTGGKADRMRKKQCKHRFF